MQLIIKKAGYWESLSVFLQDGRVPNIANQGIAMELEPAIWFKVQILESLSVDCDAHIIAWTMNSLDHKQGRLQAVSLDTSLTRSLMTIHEDLDMKEIFSKVEDILASRKATGTMTHNMCKQCAHWLHHQLLPRVTLVPSDLPLVENELQEQNNVLKLIDEALIDESTSIHKLREQLKELRETILGDIKNWVARGIYCNEFIDLFTQDIKAIETEARNKYGNVIKKLENCSADGIERLKKEKATILTEFTKLINTRSEIDKLCNCVEPKTTNQLQTQYLNISESIVLHRKARSTLNKNRILAVSVREALLSTSKRLAAGHITTGIDQGINGGMAFDVLPKQHSGIVPVNDALKTLLQDPTSIVYGKHKAFLNTIEALLVDYQTILMSSQRVSNLNGITGDQQQAQLNMEFIASYIQEHFEEIIELAHESCDIGTISSESFRQQAWLAYETFFFENYSEKLFKLYQIEKQSFCGNLMLDGSKVCVEDLSIPPKATWLSNFASQLLSEDNFSSSTSSSSTSSSSLDNGNPLISFLHDIKCLEYSHTPLAKMQLMTSAFRKCGTILSNAKGSSGGNCVSCDDFIPFLVVCLVKMSPNLRCLVYLNCCFLADVIPPFLTMGWHGYSHTSFQAACNVTAKLLLQHNR